MFITNELIRSSISNTPNIVQSSLLDIETFSKGAHQEIISTIHEGMTTATERIKYDLESKCTGMMIQIPFVYYYIQYIYIHIGIIISKKKLL